MSSAAARARRSVVPEREPFAGASPIRSRRRTARGAPGGVVDIRARCWRHSVHGHRVQWPPSEATGQWLKRESQVGHEVGAFVHDAEDRPRRGVAHPTPSVTRHGGFNESHNQP